MFGSISFIGNTDLDDTSPLNFSQGCLLHQRENYQVELVKLHKLGLFYASPWDKKGTTPTIISLKHKPFSLRKLAAWGLGKGGQRRGLGHRGMWLPSGLGCHSAGSGEQVRSSPAARRSRHRDLTQRAKLHRERSSVTYLNSQVWSRVNIMFQVTSRKNNHY